jgi:hypothetical protein
VSPRTSLSDAKDAVKSGVKETPISGAKRHYNLCKKDDKKVAKKDDKKVAKGQPIAALFICVFLDTKKKCSLFICIHYCDNLF